MVKKNQTSTGQMTEENSIASQLSVAMTSTGMTFTGEITVTPSSPRGIEYYFQIAAMVIGVIGTAANALVLYALIASKQHKKNVLIVHQNAIDLFTSVFITVTYVAKLCNIRLTGSVGYWLCTTILSECISWCGTNASALNLAIITVERYLKVVYPAWCQNKLRSWMLYSAMAMAWIITVINNIAMVFPTSGVIDRVCYAYAIWKNQMARISYFVWNFLAFYIIILIIFMFCYWRILLAIRRQARVMASHAASASNAAHNKYNQIQSNVTKTMIFVSTCYAISWLPSYTVYMIFIIHPYPVAYGDIYYGCMLLAYSYMCTNPFIYATKLDPVKNVLLRVILCEKPPMQGAVAAA